MQAIRWIGSDKISGARLSANPHIHPVRIDKDALGPERPSRDMMVSSQHRIVIHDDAAGKMYGSPKILVPAIALLANEKTAKADVKCTTYIHLLFDQHEIIFANGIETKSFHPNNKIMNGLDRSVQDEIYAIYPKLRSGTMASGYGPTALPALSVTEGQHLANIIWGSRYTRFDVVP